MGHREAVLKAATTLFHQKGFARTTADEVAFEASITKRTLYRYFRNKEAILLAIHEQFLERLLGPVDLQGSTEERFKALIRNYVETVLVYSEEIRVFFEERKHLSPPSVDKVVRLRDRHEDVFRDTLKSGISDSTLRQVNVPLATEGILGSVASLYQWHRHDGPLTTDQVAETVSSLFLRGLGSTSAILADVKYVPGTGREPYLRPPAAALSVEQAAAPTWEDNPVLTRILDAASALFYEHGYDKTSTRELAEAAQLSKSALYYYVPSKESVLFQLNLRLTVDGIESLQRIQRDNTDPVEALHEVILWQSSSVARNLGALRALSYEMRFLDEAHYGQIKVLRDEYTRLFCSVIRAAAGLPDDAGGYSDVISMTILGMLNFMHHWYKPSGRLSPQEIGEVFFDLVWRGLLAEPRSS
ncbi:TetR family transcriptional regulator [Streptomyces sp. NPDC057636]|uniref:TetR family transcriptional regulator n=1 Tax=Streptomyces sp. NPDC057636 TaxID=3346189 RepID=UPI0036A5B820